MKEINEAYDVLSDVEKRAAYDRLRRGGYRAGEDFQPPPDWDEGFEFSGATFDGAEGEFSDFFETLFGGLVGGTAGRLATPPRWHAGAKITTRASRSISRTRSNGAQRRVTLQIPEWDDVTVRRVRLQNAVDFGIPKGIRTVRDAAPARHGPGWRCRSERRRFSAPRCTFARTGSFDSKARTCSWSFR